MAKRSEPGRLNDLQENFCQEYLKDCNATQAAIRAGYAPNAAQEQSSRLLSKAIVAQRIQELMDARAKRVEITADYVLGTIKNTIERCQTDEDYNPQAVLKGSELLGKHLKLFTDKVEHSADESLEALLTQRPGSKEEE
jgi:phage terminase small subunit